MWMIGTELLERLHTIVTNNSIIFSLFNNWHLFSIFEKLEFFLLIICIAWLSAMRTMGALWTFLTIRFLLHFDLL